MRIYINLLLYKTTKYRRKKDNARNIGTRSAQRLV